MLKEKSHQDYQTSYGIVPPDERQDSRPYILGALLPDVGAQKISDAIGYRGRCLL